MYDRRPSPLLKSPSCDSESSDPNQSLTCGVHGFVSSRLTRLTTRIDKRALLRQYRTDSETTDDQVTVQDEGICVEQQVIHSKECGREEVKTKEQSVFTLPEIVVDHCSNLPEQESTESAKSAGSSTHNSLDDAQDPALQFSQSGSSSRSESPTLSDKNSVISASLQVIGISIFYSY